MQTYCNVIYVTESSLVNPPRLHIKTHILQNCTVISVNPVHPKCTPAKTRYVFMYVVSMGRDRQHLVGPTLYGSLNIPGMSLGNVLSVPNFVLKQGCNISPSVQNLRRKRSLETNV